MLERAAMPVTPTTLPKSRELSFSELVLGRKLDDGAGTGAGCPSTCNGKTCDEWQELFKDGAMTCELAESSYGCDCSGCDCDGRDGTAAPVSSPSLAPVLSPSAQPTETSVPTVFSTAMPTKLYNYKYKQCFDLYGAPYTAFPSSEPTRYASSEPTMTPAPSVSLLPHPSFSLQLPPRIAATSRATSPGCIPHHASTLSPRPAPPACPILSSPSRPRSHL